ncbi:MAG: InlB B-repeat-containing protein [Clostridia bacterium]|nr:InlB B-repeat-containing protein [Clostridia bacterium]
MKKAFFVLLLSLVLAFSLLACDNGSGGPDDGTQPTRSFTVTWIDENGNTISSDTIDAGSIPTCNYTVEDTVEWDYTLEGWATSVGGDVLSAIPAADANATYYAVVTAVKQKYTVTFNTGGGSNVPSQTVEYGEILSLPETPTYDGHRFVGWSYDQNGMEAVDFNKAITANDEYFAIWNEVVDAKALLASLLSGYSLNPWSFIPECMRSDYAQNVVQSNEIIQDYSSFIDTASIVYGFGEQWHMVHDNLEQSEAFFSVLSVIDTVAASSITAFNNYFDSNPADTARHTFMNGNYDITIDLSQEFITYVIEYSATLPIFGEQSIQIALAMHIESGERIGRIQLGDANALSYKFNENSYEFAIKYLGVRRAMLSIERTNDGVNGKIYEYLTVSSLEIGSCAEFYITDNYVSVVGNKADNMIGFTGYINELYDATNGRMLGYEVKETLSSIVYNTLWFNISDIAGISSIKYQPASEDAEATVYTNNKSTAWENKKVGGIGVKMLSRRYDIEFRTQYVYSYDVQSGKYVEHKIQVPMLFVQEENYGTLVDDIEEKNNISIVITLSNAHIEKIMLDYDILIPAFELIKDEMTSQEIVDYIGSKIEF